MKTIAGLREIAGLFDAFVIDLWGVLHDGVQAFPDAVDTLLFLQRRPTFLLSNAPRRVSSVARTLARLGIPADLYTDMLTSGEACWRALARREERGDPWFAALGPRVFHLGPERDRSVLADLPFEIAATPDEADWVLNTGPDDCAATAPLANFMPLLKRCADARLPMLCANPDLVVHRGHERLLCAGALAEAYTRLGGDMRMLGKPDPDIYRMLLGTAPARRTLVIGDSLRTDIAGAAAVGCAALWITGGIDAHDAASDGAEVVARRAGLDPDYAMEVLRP